MRHFIILLITTISLCSCLPEKSISRYDWKFVKSASTHNPDEHAITNDYYLSFTKGYLNGFTIKNDCCKKKEELKYFADYTDFFWVRKKRKGAGNYSISTGITNRYKSLYYKILQDKNLLNLDHVVFFDQSHGTMKLQNDTLIISLQKSTDSPRDWVIWKLVKYQLRK